MKNFVAKIFTITILTLGMFTFALSAGSVKAAGGNCVEVPTQYGTTCVPCVPNSYGICVPIVDTGIVRITENVDARIVLASALVFAAGVVFTLNGSAIKYFISDNA